MRKEGADLPTGFGSVRAENAEGVTVVTTGDGVNLRGNKSGHAPYYGALWVAARRVATRRVIQVTAIAMMIEAMPAVISGPLLCLTNLAVAMAVVAQVNYRSALAASRAMRATAIETSSAAIIGRP